MNNIEKTEINSQDAPKAIGPYSQAIRSGQFLFCSGQIGIEPQSGSLIGPSVIEQTEQVLKNLQAVLKSAGADFQNVVKTNIYLKSLDDYPLVNEIYGRTFKDPFPARAAVEVSKLPLNALVEIEAIAVIP